MIRGSCLCGGVAFEILEARGPFELCHCSRCRKATGSAFAASLHVAREDLKLLQGQELIRAYEAPIREAPPAFRRCFCMRCGACVPDTLSKTPMLEVPAGTLDDDPHVRPDKHIYVELKAPWHTISDSLPQLDKPAVAMHRVSMAHRKTFTALLRGVNVGGGRKIEMAKLRSVCASIGLEDAQTYIQSGNVVFAVDDSPTELERRLEEAIEREFRFTVSVVVRSKTRWTHYIRTNPFTAESQDTPNLVVLALPKSRVKASAAAALEQRATRGERVVADRDALWIYYPGGIGRSKLSPTVLDRVAGSPVTTRNWRTVHTLDRMMHADAGG